MSKFVDENLKLRSENMELMKKLMEKMEEEHAKCKENIELKTKLNELEGQIAEFKEKNAELKDQHTKSMKEIEELKAEKLSQDQRMSNNAKMAKILNKIEEMKQKEIELKEKLDKKIAKMAKKEQKKETKIAELKNQMSKFIDGKRVLISQFEELLAVEQEKHSEPVVTIESIQQRKRAADEESDSTTTTKKLKYLEKESKSKSISQQQKPTMTSITTKKTATNNNNGSKRNRKEEKKNSEKKISETATKGGYIGFDIEQLFSDPKGDSNIVPSVDEHGEGDANNTSKENTPKISRGMQQDSEPAPTFFATKTSTRLGLDLHKAESERREFQAKSRGQQQSIQQQKEIHGMENFVKRQGELGNKRVEQDQYRDIKQEIDIKIKQRDKELEEQRASFKFKEN